MAAQRRVARRVYDKRFFAQHRAHFAALLIAFCAAPLFAQSDITFDPSITQGEFVKFSHVIAQAIFPTPVQPARATGILGWDAGVAVTLASVNRDATYWRHAVPGGSDFTVSGFATVPRLVVSKGFGFGTIAASYATLAGSGVATYGGSLDVPLLRGSVVTPELAVRGSYATISGADSLSLKTYGLEAFLSKGFGPAMPYVAVGKMRADSRGTVRANSTALSDSSDVTRYTAGVRFSLLLPKIAIEATKAEVNSYAAKVSFGF